MEDLLGPSTNAFRNLVAWFPKGSTHATAVYTWIRHKGIVATVEGVENGKYPVDVIFSRPGNAFLERFPDLGIEILDVAWMNASLKAGELCKILPYRLQLACQLSRVTKQLPSPQSLLDKTSSIGDVNDEPRQVDDESIRAISTEEYYSLNDYQEQRNIETNNDHFMRETGPSPPNNANSSPDLPSFDIYNLERKPVYQQKLRNIPDTTETPSEARFKYIDLTKPEVPERPIQERFDKMFNVIDAYHSKNGTGITVKIESPASIRFARAGPIPWQAWKDVKTVKVEKEDNPFTQHKSAKHNRISYSTRKGLPAFKREDIDVLLADSSTPLSLKRKAFDSVERPAYGKIPKFGLL